MTSVFLLTRRALYGGWDWLEAGFVGVWLGLSSRRMLYAIDEAHYRRAGRYHTIEHNLRGWFDWEEQPAREWFTDRKCVAVLGAGAGREVIALARMGQRARGFECNPALVDLGNRLLAQETADCSIELLPREQAPDGSYDAVIIGWSAYMLIPGRELRVALLRQLHAILPDRAPLLLSFFTRAGSERRFRRIARIGSAIRLLMGRSAVEPGDDLVPNYVHWFTREEIEAELRDGGFEPADFAPQHAGPTASGWAVGLRSSVLHSDPVIAGAAGAVQ